MKKFFIFILVPALMIFFTACSDNKDNKNGDSQKSAAATDDLAQNSGGTDNSLQNTTAGQSAPVLKPSIDPASGWELNELPDYLSYSKDTSSISITPDFLTPDYNTPETYLTYIRGKIKQIFENAVLGDTSKTTVNGYEARNFTYTNGVGQKYLFVSVFNGTNVYDIECAADVSGFDSKAAEFQSMINSFTLKE